ncbi:MAG TPA: hypothetical protein VHG29_03185 [Novosphingobium sp.]|nr:hypothetical protein [Novosphingobium sp.]
MKRASILLAGAAAVLPVALLNAQTVVPSGAAEFAPPAAEMVLTRTIHRSLTGGKELLARRRYAVRIVPDGAGYRVDGQLIDCAVEAPAALQAIAELERKRPESGPFPLLLDATGRIVEATASRSTDAVRQGAALVTSRVAQSALSLAEKAQAETFLSALAARGASGAEWPRDLFRPAPGHRSEVKRLTLPGGGEGTVTVSTAARTSSANGLLEAIERVVVTDMGGDRRETREEWSLSASTS